MERRSGVAKGEGQVLEYTRPRDGMEGSGGGYSSLVGEESGGGTFYTRGGFQALQCALPMIWFGGVER